MEGGRDFEFNDAGDYDAKQASCRDFLRCC